MKLTLRIFTHPACPRCGIAVKTAWDYQEEGERAFELRMVSLAEKEGLAEAQAEKVTTSPTLILSDGERELQRIVGAPKQGELEASFRNLDTVENTL